MGTLNQVYISPESDTAWLDFSDFPIVKDRVAEEKKRTQKGFNQIDKSTGKRWIEYKEYCLSIIPEAFAVRGNMYLSDNTKNRWTIRDSDPKIKWGNQLSTHSRIHERTAWKSLYLKLKRLECQE